MASPQCENGYTKIANELFEAILRSKWHGQELRVMLAVLRLTYGYGKKEDTISYGQISKITGIPRVKVFELIKRLSLYRGIAISPQGNRQPAIMRINKDFETWLAIPPQGNIPPQGTSPIPPQGNRSVPLQGNLQRKKEIKPKKPTKPPVLVLPDWLEKDLWDDFKEHRRRLRKPMTQKAEEILIKKLGWLREKGYNPRHLLITSIERGWLSVFEPDRKDG